ncbi:hypothetical protein ID866_7259 [Astraeus odoratus]|nr:hypothetical protein ID866_7259 [Astraeus odoratus]
MKDGKLSIAMVSDFFHPDVGGVENHIFMLGANLIRMGHKVCNSGIVQNRRCVFNPGRSRENTVLRGQLFEQSEDDSSVSIVRPSVYTIPNALVAEQFTPSPQPQQLETMVLSRLAYRKGIDLLVATAPRVCAAFPNVKFIEETARNSMTCSKCTAFSLPKKVLTRGSIFLNTSLTESFGIAILEAACTGLYVVSTRVGGVPEILPEDMISFANPDEDGTLPWHSSPLLRRPPQRVTLSFPRCIPGNIGSHPHHSRGKAQSIARARKG